MAVRYLVNRGQVFRRNPKRVFTASPTWAVDRVRRVGLCKARRDGAHSDEDQRLMREAMEEAATLYQQASKMATLQTLQELMQSTLSDGPSIATVLPGIDALESFWVEQGLTRSESAALVKERLNQERGTSLEQLAAKVQRWGRVLPEVQIAKVIAKDPGLLDADVNLGVTNLIIMVSLLPGCDIMDMIMKQPRLLWARDFRERCDRVVKKLVQLHPSGDQHVIHDIIAENPELLFRMDYYMSADQVDDLPVEIQNMMVLADQGIGFLYKFYRPQKYNYMKLSDEF